MSLQCGPPYVSEKRCSLPLDPVHGHRSVCPQPYLYGQKCYFECDAGYRLPVDGVSEIECVLRMLPGGVDSAVVWDHHATPCVRECLILVGPASTTLTNRIHRKLLSKILHNTVMYLVDCCLCMLTFVLSR